MIIRLIGDAWSPTDKVAISARPDQVVAQRLPIMCEKLGVSSLDEFTLWRCTRNRQPCYARGPIDVTSTWADAGITRVCFLYLRQRTDDPTDAELTAAAIEAGGAAAEAGDGSLEEGLAVAFDVSDADDDGDDDQGAESPGEAYADDFDEVDDVVVDFDGSDGDDDNDASLELPNASAVSAASPVPAHPEQHHATSNDAGGTSGHSEPSARGSSVSLSALSPIGGAGSVGQDNSVASDVPSWVAASPENASGSRQATRSSPRHAFDDTDEDEDDDGEEGNANDRSVDARAAPQSTPVAVPAATVGFGSMRPDDSDSSDDDDVDTDEATDEDADEDADEDDDDGLFSKSANDRLTSSDSIHASSASPPADGSQSLDMIPTNEATPQQHPQQQQQAAGADGAAGARASDLVDFDDLQSTSEFIRPKPLDGDIGDIPERSDSPELPSFSAKYTLTPEQSRRLSAHIAVPEIGWPTRAVVDRTFAKIAAAGGIIRKSRLQPRTSPPAADAAAPHDPTNAQQLGATPTDEAAALQPAPVGTPSLTHLYSDIRDAAARIDVKMRTRTELLRVLMVKHERVRVKFDPQAVPVATPHGSCHNSPHTATGSTSV